MNLKSDMVINTGPFLCAGGQLQEHYWAPPVDIRVKKSVLWVGLDFNIKSDCHAEARRLNDYSLINVFQWDRYGNPNGPHQVTQDYGEDWMELGPTNPLVLYSFAASPKGHCHVVLSLWWQE